MNKLLEVKNLSYSVKGEKDEISILQDISFDLEKNMTLGVAGESGSGKTTLGKLLAEVLTSGSGEINYYFNGGKRSKKTNPVQILFQNNGEILNPFRRVSDVVDEAVTLKSGKKEAVEKRVTLFHSLNFSE